MPKRGLKETETDQWLKLSRGVASALSGYMESNNLSRADLATELGVSQQYISRVLSGTVNFSFKSIAKIEAALGVNCIEPVNFSREQKSSRI